MNESHYINLDQIASFVGQEFHSSLKTFHANMRSARNKLDALEVLLSELKIRCHAIMLTETWYENNDVPFSAVGYNTYNLNRQSGRGGGVAILITKDLKCEVMPSFTYSTRDIEIITLQCKQIVFITIYCTPDGNVASFFGRLERLFSYINENKINIICGGDFNINLLCDSEPVKQFNLLLAEHNMINTISLPTRITTSSSTLIDLFLTNYNSCQTKAGVLTYYISDHLPIFLCVNPTVKHKRAADKIHYQEILPSQLHQFRHNIMVFNSQDTNVAYDLFMSKFKELYSRHFPFKTISISSRVRKPWITNGLLAKIKIKNRLYPHKG